MKICAVKGKNELAKLPKIEKAVRIGIEKARQEFNSTSSFSISQRNDSISCLARLWVRCEKYLKSLNKGI